MGKEKYQKEILEICKKKHLTPCAILAILQKKFPQAGVATVYRTIKTLSEKNLLNKIHGVAEKCLYETNEHFHGHIVEKNTLKDFEIPPEFIPQIEKKIGKKIQSLDLKVYI